MTLTRRRYIRMRDSEASALDQEGSGCCSSTINTHVPTCGSCLFSERRKGAEMMMWITAETGMKFSNNERLVNQGQVESSEGMQLGDRFSAVFVWLWRRFIAKFDKLLVGNEHSMEARFLEQQQLAIMHSILYHLLNLREPLVLLCSCRYLAGAWLYDDVMMLAPCCLGRYLINPECCQFKHALYLQKICSCCDI